MHVECYTLGLYAFWLLRLFIALVINVVKKINKRAV